MLQLEKSLTETLGTRVMIENRPNGGRVVIDFFSEDDLSQIAAILAERREIQAGEVAAPTAMPIHPNTTQLGAETPATTEDDLYSVSNFAV